MTVYGEMRLLNDSREDAQTAFQEGSSSLTVW